MADAMPPPQEDPLKALPSQFSVAWTNSIPYRYTLPLSEEPFISQRKFYSGIVGDDAPTAGPSGALDREHPLIRGGEEDTTIAVLEDEQPLSPTELQSLIEGQLHAMRAAYKEGVAGRSPQLVALSHPKAVEVDRRLPGAILGVLTPYFVEQKPFTPAPSLVFENAGGEDRCELVSGEATIFRFSTDTSWQVIAEGSDPLPLPKVKQPTLLFSDFSPERSPSSSEHVKLATEGGGATYPRQQTEGLCFVLSYWTPSRALEIRYRELVPERGDETIERQLEEEQRKLKEAEVRKKRNAKRAAARKKAKSKSVKVAATTFDASGSDGAKWTPQQTTGDLLLSSPSPLSPVTLIESTLADDLHFGADSTPTDSIRSIEYEEGDPEAERSPRSMRKSLYDWAEDDDDEIEPVEALRQFFAKSSARRTNALDQSGQIYRWQTFSQ